jgi:hypothetical protein
MDESPPRPFAHLNAPLHELYRRVMGVFRVGAGDYLDAAAAGESETLKGPPVSSPWDARLAAEMRASGRAVMEERLIPLRQSAL